MPTRKTHPRNQKPDIEGALVALERLVNMTPEEREAHQQEILLRQRVEKLVRRLYRVSSQEELDALLQKELNRTKRSPTRYKVLAVPDT